jgi:hypothetical protein
MICFDGCMTKVTALVRPDSAMGTTEFRGGMAQHAAHGGADKVDRRPIFEINFYDCDRGADQAMDKLAAL